MPRNTCFFISRLSFKLGSHFEGTISFRIFTIREKLWNHFCYSMPFRNYNIFTNKQKIIFFFISRFHILVEKIAMKSWEKNSPIIFRCFVPSFFSSSWKIIGIATNFTFEYQSNITIIGDLFMICSMSTTKYFKK